MTQSNEIEKDQILNGFEMPGHIDLESICCGVFDVIKNQHLHCNECDMGISEAINRVNRKIRKFEEVLSYYADPENWKCRLHKYPEESPEEFIPMDTGGYYQLAEELPIIKDRGNKAKEVLAAKE